MKHAFTSQTKIMDKVQINNLDKPLMFQDTYTEVFSFLLCFTQSSNWQQNSYIMYIT